jgi:putative ABC transport system substrate-binding protein
MRRRDFIAGLGGAAAWPLAVRAQQRALPVVGVPTPLGPLSAESLIAPFRAGLAETGYVDGRNVAVEFQWAEGQYVRLKYDRLPALAADLVRRRVAMIFAVGPLPRWPLSWRRRTFRLCLQPVPTPSMWAW